MSKALVKSPAQGHIPALDGIRGLAILGVLFVHFFGNFAPANALERVFRNFSGLGTLGIDLFFMLSGFLITGILLDTKSRENYLKNFWIRRFLRIFPLYYLVLSLILLALIILPADLVPSADKIWEAQPWAWTYLFNFFIAREGDWTVPFIGHFWSLAVEEQFYLIWPLLVYRLSARRLMQLCVGLILLACALHLWMEINGSSKVSIHVLTPLRLNAICMGALLATWLRQDSVLQLGSDVILRWAKCLLLGSVLVKIIIVIIVKQAPHTSDVFEAFRTMTWLGIFAALHLAAVVCSKSSLINRSLTLRPLTFLGKYSYGLYVFHHFLLWPSYHVGVIPWLTEVFGSQILAVLINGLASIVLSIAMAWLSFHFFEKHFLRWKDKFAPRSAATLQAKHAHSSV
jgi:peptidoglycan/LPS O-acetylase OafA/YrhL